MNGIRQKKGGRGKGRDKNKNRSQWTRKRVFNREDQPMPKVGGLERLIKINKYLGRVVKEKKKEEKNKYHLEWKGDLSTEQAQNYKENLELRWR